jgi:hypothetical protein
MTRIIRVFPRRTKATPTDALAIAGRGPKPCDEADEIHVSCAFTWDMPAAEKLAKAWAPVATVKVGGPAFPGAAGTFEPGLYLRHGYTITSRGCPERCWFCTAWKRDGDRARELPVRDGWNILDDNLLACSIDHVRQVCDMLARQGRDGHRAQFTGGLHAARITESHVHLLAQLRPRPVVFLAYDEDRDLDPLRLAVRNLLAAGWTARSHRLRCYVLAGYSGDTQEAAEARCQTVLGLGVTPMAMVYRGPDGVYPDGWARWQRRWARPAIIHARNRP